MYNAAMEDSLEVIYKVKHNLTIQSSHHTTWYLSEGFENLCKQKSNV